MPARWRRSLVLALPVDGDVARVATFRARLAHRLARHLPTSSATLAPSTALVSFTFDDAPLCACTAGADMLAAHGATGTFYIAGGLIGTRTGHWQLADDGQLAALHAAGHEIGCHTYSHPFMPDLGAAATVAELRPNHERLRAAVPGLRLQSFAYPYGYGSITAKRAVSGLYRTGRGIGPGINVGRTDLHLLRANPLMDGHVDAAGIGRLMDEALARSGWLIFYGHDVRKWPSPYGCSPQLLETALRAASSRGIPCITVAEALRRSV